MAAGTAGMERSASAPLASRFSMILDFADQQMTPVNRDECACVPSGGCAVTARRATAADESALLEPPFSRDERPPGRSAHPPDSRTRRDRRARRESTVMSRVEDGEREVDRQRGHPGSWQKRRSSTPNPRAQGPAA
jgi:hypothetical protein